MRSAPLPWLVRQGRADNNGHSSQSRPVQHSLRMPVPGPALTSRQHAAFPTGQVQPHHLMLHAAHSCVSPAECHKAKGVAALVLEQAGAELGQAAKEEAKAHGQLARAALSQAGLGALEQRGGEGKAIQAQRSCRQRESRRRRQQEI